MPRLSSPRVLPAWFSTAVLCTVGLGLSACGSPSVMGAAQAVEERPNILWLTCEDMGPHIGPYGDRYATTPNLDRFAKRALRYDVVWSNAPVCAPARTGLISGLYPPATGAEQMRSLVSLPPSFRMYPQYLREKGYYCTNNSKEDYNLEKPGQVWDESSPRAHWKARKSGQPFFAIFNSTVTHESQIRRRPHALVHDPAKATLPAYHPDTPEVRRDWAQYYDNITRMDAEMGAHLKELEDAGLAESTIVFFYSDHGSGMPRSKRTACDSGLRVPLLVHFPEKWRRLAPPEYREGGATDRPVSLLDLPPTLLTLAAIQPPDYYQGRAFMGPHAAPRQRYLFGFRGRMDERIDLVRSARDERYAYVRNYLPHRPHGQHVSYQFETPATRVWKERFAAGSLNPAQRAFWERRPAEELYDLRTDPDEVKNLAASPAHREVLERMRKAVREHALRIRDVGFLPEGEMHARSQGATPYELGHNPARYDPERILAAAELASDPAAGGLPRLRTLLKHEDSAVRYWAATGFLVRGEDAVRAGRDELRGALADSSPYVRVPAAEALVRHGSEEDAAAALKGLGELLADDRPVWLKVAALNAIDELDSRAASLLPLVRECRDNGQGRFTGYVPRLVEKISADLEREA